MWFVFVVNYPLILSGVLCKRSCGRILFAPRPLASSLIISCLLVLEGHPSLPPIVDVLEPELVKSFRLLFCLKLGIMWQYLFIYWNTCMQCTRAHAYVCMRVCTYVRACVGDQALEHAETREWIIVGWLVKRGYKEVRERSSSIFNDNEIIIPLIFFQSFWSEV